jgi:hypothetical protein
VAWGWADRLRHGPGWGSQPARQSVPISGFRVVDRRGGLERGILETGLGQAPVTGGGPQTGADNPPAPGTRASETPDTGIADDENQLSPKNRCRRGEGDRLTPCPGFDGWAEASTVPFSPPGRRCPKGG